MTEWLLFVVTILGIFIFLGIVILFVKKNQGAHFVLMQQQVDLLKDQVRTNLDNNAQLIMQQLGQVTQSMSQNLNNLTGQVNERLKDNVLMLQNASINFGDRLDNASKVVGAVQNRLGKIEEANLRIYEIGKDISRLQEILRAPKLRGNLGEFFLGDLLSQILPQEHFKLQYTFKNGEKVDAVIKLSQGLVPIDAKFPLENFRKFLDVEGASRKNLRKQFVNDVKKHIDAISSKYIKQDERTFDFALMYIPAENVYYEIIIKGEEFGENHAILNYALDKRVIPVSPNSFYSYLQVILLGLKGLRIEEGVHQILGSLERVRKDFERFKEDFTVLGKHLNNARNTYDNADKRLDGFENKLDGAFALDAKKIKGIKE
ncbi:DNA recombination protein RmuC [Chlamydiota bacterium]